MYKNKKMAYNKGVYSRELLTPPEIIIKNGKAVFGSFSEPFECLDIRGLRRPFGNLPLPSFISNLRIRATLTYVFSAEEYIGAVEFYDSKIFGFVEVIIWEVKTGRKYAYRRILGPHSRIVPKSTSKAVCLSSSKKRFVKISWSRKENRLSVFCNLKGDDVRPHISLGLNVDFLDSGFAQYSAVNPAPIQRRCSASYYVTGTHSGSILIGNSEKESINIPGISLMDIKRMYYKLRTHADIMTGLSFLDGKAVSFKMMFSNMSAADEYRYNENVLFVDGKVTTLPPVKITRPKGVTGIWIVQDTESMVDLSFTPVSDTLRALSALILHTEYHLVYGMFNGVLRMSDGTSLVLKEFPGVAKKIRLRN